MAKTCWFVIDIITTINIVIRFVIFPFLSVKLLITISYENITHVMLECVLGVSHKGLAIHIITTLTRN